MDAVSKLIQAIGAMADMTAIFYPTLLKAGLPDDVVVTLTAKMLGEVIKARGSEQKEDEQ